MNRQWLARFGEEKACFFLQSKGYKILEKNYRKNNGEIDLIAIDKDTLVFIEVKTRYSFNFGKPEESITKRKLLLVAKTGEYYKLVHPDLPALLRIDAVVLEINHNHEVTRMELIKNAQIT